MLPVRQTFAKKFTKLHKVDWFGDKTVRAYLITHQHIILGVFRRKYHDGNITRNVMQAQLSQYRQPIQFWQFQVQQEDVWHLPLLLNAGVKPFQCGFTPTYCGQIDLGATIGYGTPSKIHLVQIVINEQYVVAVCICHDTPINSRTRQPSSKSIRL
jgi:hypothetical protein